MDESVQQTVLRPPISMSKLKEKKKVLEGFQPLGFPQQSLMLKRNILS